MRIPVISMLCILFFGHLGVLAGCYGDGRAWYDSKSDLRPQARQYIRVQCRAWGGRSWSSKEVGKACYEIGQNTRLNLKLAWNGSGRLHINYETCVLQLEQWVNGCKKGGFSSDRSKGLYSEYVNWSFPITVDAFLVETNFLRADPNKVRLYR